MINVVYHDKTLIFIGTTFREKLISHYQAMNMFQFIKAATHVLYPAIINVYE